MTSTEQMNAIIENNKVEQPDYLREGVGQFLSEAGVDTTPVPPEAMQQIQGVIPSIPGIGQSLSGANHIVDPPLLWQHDVSRQLHNEELKGLDPAAIFGAPPQPPTDATIVSNQVKVDGVWQDVPSPNAEAVSGLVNAFCAVLTPPLTPGEAPSGVNAVFKAPPPMTTAGMTVPPPMQPPTPVELADGIPWDERIHAGSKTKMKAAPHGWKLKKQPGEYATKDVWLAYVAEVEAELRNVMAVSPPTVAMACGKILGSAPPVPPTPNMVTMTYAGLTEAITKAGIMPAAVQAALVGVGLISYPTLATQPELIPQVAKLLGLGA
jgi:hypothetical protein